MSKSYVSIGQAICPVCGKVHDTGEILIDRRFQESLERKTITGSNPCSDCQSKFDGGYIAMVEIDPQKSTISSDGMLKQENAYRTGGLAWVRKRAADEIFNVPIQPLNFVDHQVIEMLSSMQVG